MIAEIIGGPRDGQIIKIDPMRLPVDGELRFVEETLVVSPLHGMSARRARMRHVYHIEDANPLDGKARLIYVRTESAEP